MPRTDRGHPGTTSLVREIEALLGVASALVSSVDLREALRRICRELARLIGAETVSVHLHDPDSDLLVPCAAYHIPKEHLEVLSTTPLRLRDQGFYLPLWEERRPVWSDDIGHDPRFSHELFRLIPHQSGLLLPLILDGEVAGAFYLVWWRARRRFTEEELSLLETVSGQATLLLRNLHLYERAERDRRRLTALYEVSRHLAAVHDTDEILSLIVAEAARLLGVEAAGIRLLEGEDLVVRAKTESAAALMSRSRLKVGESLSGLVVSGGEPIAVEDLAQDTRYDAVHKRGALREGFHGFLGVPLRVHDRTIGVLNVYARRRRRFIPDEVSLLSAFADQASLAIDKARLYAEARAREREAAKLYEVTGQLASSLDLERVLDLIAAQTVNLLGCDASGIYTYDGGRSGLGFLRGLNLDPELTGTLVLKSGEGVAGRAFQERRPVWTGDRLLDPSLQYTPAADALIKTKAPRAYLAVPIISRGQVYGVLLDYFLLPHEFTPQEVRLLSTLADHAAVAMEKSQLYRESVERVKALEEALARVQQLQGLLPICAWCKKVRNDQNYWQSVEGYVAEHTDARFSHGICPECKEKLRIRRDANG